MASWNFMVPGVSARVAFTGDAGWHNLPSIGRTVVMPTRNVVLTDRQAEFVEKLVTSGRYQNASEVLRDGLRLVERRDAEEAIRLKALREAVKTGIADADEGRYVAFESPDALRRRLKTVADNAIAATPKPKR
jgi:antitoxin ParD1/3/4